MNIIICTSCEGEGKIKCDDHYGDWHMEKCTKCNGTGRLISETYHYDLPFDFPREKIYKADSEIYKILRKLDA